MKEKASTFAQACRRSLRLFVDGIARLDHTMLGLIVMLGCVLAASQAWAAPQAPARLSRCLGQYGSIVLPGQRLIGLCVGLNRHADKRIADLKYAVHDADDLTEILNEQKQDVYDSAKVAKLTDGAATRKGVLAALDTLIKSADKRDTAIVYLAGNGKNINRRFYFVTFDANVDDIDHTALALSDLSPRLVQLAARCRRVILMVDTCDSGAINVDRELITAIAEAKGSLIALTSSGANELSLEFEKVRHGAFTEAVLEAIHGRGGNGNVTIRSLVEYVQRRVDDLTDHKQHPQAPLLIDTEATLPLFAPHNRRVGGAEPPPICRFLTPSPSQTAEGASVTALVEVTAAKRVEGVRFYLNGVPVPQLIAKPIEVTAKPIVAGAKDVPPGYNYVSTFRSVIPLQRSERRAEIRVVAYYDYGRESDAVVSLVPSAGATSKGDLYVLSIGISHYEDPRHNLQFAAIDAEAMSSCLAAQKGRLYRNVHRVTLTDRQATVPAILAALQKLKAAGPADTIIVFLSGHGVQDNGKYYFAPYNVNAADISHTCLEWSSIVDALSGIYAPKLIFADACHAGASLGPAKATTAQFQAPGSGIVMYSACDATQFSVEDPALGHGAFAQALLEALDGGKADANRDKVVTLIELFAYVQQRVFDLEKGVQTPQIAHYEHGNMLQKLAAAE